MTHWHDTMVDRPETDGTVYATGWTISGLAVLGAGVQLRFLAAGQRAGPAHDLEVREGAGGVLGQLEHQAAVDQVAGRGQGGLPQLTGARIVAPELAEARESIWTPEKEQPAETPKLWTPGT